MSDSYPVDGEGPWSENNGQLLVQECTKGIRILAGQLGDDVDWVLRIDSDEYLTPELICEVREKLASISEDVEGIYIPRRMKFMGQTIRPLLQI